ncbi:MAG: hypothetical protein QW727_01555 [Candidatus Pacearchaeota archaeon]
MIGECKICGEEERLFEAITEEGIKSVCRLCLRSNNLPLVKKLDIEQIKDENKFYKTGDEIIKRDSNKNIKNYPDDEMKKSNEELKKIIQKKNEAKNYEDLIDNFHWHIQQGRRRKKLSQKQLAEAIAEPEVIIEMVEKRNLPDNYDKIINKFEQFLGIKLRKEKKNYTGISDGIFNIDKVNLNEFTTTDLKKLNEEKLKKQLDANKNEDDIDMTSFNEEK